MHAPEVEILDQNRVGFEIGGRQSQRPHEHEGAKEFHRLTAAEHQMSIPSFTKKVTPSSPDGTEPAISGLPIRQAGTFQWYFSFVDEAQRLRGVVLESLDQEQDG